MKHLPLVILSLFILSCSSSKYISTDGYTDRLKARCINNKVEINDNDQEKCALLVANQISVATRLYQLRAKEDLTECKQENTDQSEVDSCFKDAQEKFYDMHFSKR